MWTLATEQALCGHDVDRDTSKTVPRSPEVLLYEFKYRMFPQTVQFCRGSDLTPGVD